MFGFGKIKTIEQAKSATVKAALLDMFKNKNHFSICTIDNCLKVANIIPDAEVYKCLSALHCMNWNDMDRKLRKWVYEAVYNIFTAEPENVDLQKFEELSLPGPAFAELSG